MNKAGVAIACVAASAAAAVLAFPPGAKIETRVAIDAPASLVWAVLTDWPAYAAWNPSMRLSGILAPGQVIENRLGDAGGKQFVFHPVVEAVKPNRELRWHGRIAMPHLFDANHYFLLRTQGKATLLIQGEKLHGIAIWLINPSDLAETFQAANQALKAQAEKKANR